MNRPATGPRLALLCQGAVGHLAVALRFSPAGPCDRMRALVAGIGMAGPVVLGTAVDQPGLGLLASVGSLALGGGEAGLPIREQLRELSARAWPLSLAAFAATWFMGTGSHGPVVTVAMAGLAALAGGFSREMAIGTARFVLYLIMIGSASHPRVPAGALLLVIHGAALWTALVALVLGALIRWFGVAETAPPALPVHGTRRQRFRRWLDTLKVFGGWQFALRITLCLAAASIPAWVWPGHHMSWVSLTVAILVQRRSGAWSIKTTQRVAGTLLGVTSAGLVLAVGQSGPATAWWLAGLVLGLAMLRQYVQARNYLVYSAVMAPLVLLLVGGAHETGSSRIVTLLDRLAATVLGALIALSVDRLTGWRQSSNRAKA